MKCPQLKPPSHGIAHIAQTLCLRWTLAAGEDGDGTTLGGFLKQGDPKSSLVGGFNPSEKY